MKRLLARVAAIMALPACGTKTIQDLPRGKASAEMDQAFDNYLKAVEEAGLEMHSVMVVQHGKVVKEIWLGDAAPDIPHVLHSVSKTFTATAVGLAINDGLLSLTDRLVNFFPDKLPDMDLLPEEERANLEAVTVRDLLTMNCGHQKEPSGVRNGDKDWVEAFLAWPFTHAPGTYYCYNSMGTYVLSAIVQKVTGEKVVDYLTPAFSSPSTSKNPDGKRVPRGSTREDGDSTSRPKTSPRWDSSSSRRADGTGSRCFLRPGWMKHLPIRSLRYLPEWTRQRALRWLRRATGCRDTATRCGAAATMHIGPTAPADSISS